MRGWIGVQPQALQVVEQVRGPPVAEARGVQLVHPVAMGLCEGLGEGLDQVGELAAGGGRADVGSNALDDIRVEDCQDMVELGGLRRDVGHSKGSFTLGLPESDIVGEELGHLGRDGARAEGSGEGLRVDGGHGHR